MDDTLSDRRRRLEELRDQLHSALTTARDEMLPQLAGQYRATLADLAALEAESPRAEVEDDLKAARERRRAGQRKKTS